MRTVSCDHCGKSAYAPGIARLDNWSTVRMTKRELGEKFGLMRTTDPRQHELCPDCTTEIIAYLTKAAP